LDADAVRRVREEAWPQPESAEEVHDALLWVGYVTDAEAEPWLPWLLKLLDQRRLVHDNSRWSAVDGPTDPKRILLGRLEALGPVPGAAEDESQLTELEREGAILRTRLDGQTVWCERRLLARIHRYTLERLRREIEPVSAAEFMQFLACWQHVDEQHRLDGPHGVAQVLRQLAGFEAPPGAWESEILERRVRDYRREWLDEATLHGEFVWGRFWGAAGSAIRVTPITFIPRDELEPWLALTDPPGLEGLSGPASDILKSLSQHGAMFPQNLQKAAALVAAHFEMGLQELVARGLATCDSFAAVRQMITPPSRRRRPLRPVGRWSTLRTGPAADAADVHHELAARQLLRRTGVVFRKTIARERIPVTWGSLIRVYRRMELRGEVRGGRFVAGFAGEQFALPQAIELLRSLRRSGAEVAVGPLGAADPMNFDGILTPAAPQSVQPPAVLAG
jgi:ATP-dependent Lhr-like helicase